MIVAHPFFQIISAASDHLSAKPSLLIQYSTHFWGYVVYDASSARVEQWKVFERKRNEEGIAEPLSPYWHSLIPSRSFERVQVINYSPRTIFIPDALNESNQQDACWNFTLGIEAGEKVLSYPVATLQAIYQHGIENEFYQSVQQQFPNTMWIPFPAIQPKEDEHSDAISMTVIGHRIYLSVKKNQVWLLHQSYDFETPEDILYYILKVLKHFELDAEQVPILLEGFIDTESAITRLITQYLRNINWNSIQRFEFPSMEEDSFTQPLAHIDRILTCVS